eukprot:CAMPEP_0176380836 /NCGR_PEP_ID=MMETSP0126-20121128/31412_1 /TAXON_ID=141414 ORGANISM="Strombidinopsis acuminatum, Strain SPMC142" /NCGR_SAMPLE_ID=MMETSP0126 /ASSEMBLY_ACC=CAM_ASM_000229 /LENGTH=76 /DNA_ID=CAMNT_0017744323 /DNA_START=365 /DNA_END=595 /DNA_ORIENTATION=+
MLHTLLQKDRESTTKILSAQEQALSRQYLASQDIDAGDLEQDMRSLKNMWYQTIDKKRQIGDRSHIGGDVFYRAQD